MITLLLYGIQLMEEGKAPVMIITTFINWCVIIMLTFVICEKCLPPVSVELVEVFLKSFSLLRVGEWVTPEVLF